MRIAAARVEPLRLALRRPLVTARGTLAERHGFVLHVTSADGVDGRGEASPVYWLGEGSLAATAAALARVVERAAARPTLADARGWLVDEALALPADAACALDGALVDLAARSRGVSAATVLSAGAATAAPVSRESAGGAEGTIAVEVAALVGGATPDEVATEAAAALALGFRTLKLKVGGAVLADDRMRVAAVRARVGGDVRLRLDANRAWTPDAAAEALAVLASFAPEYVEEPLAEGDAASVAALARTTTVPLAVDESLRDDADLTRLIAVGVPVHVVLKAVRVGGPTRLVALARRAAAAGLAVTVTDAIESAVGMGHAVHAAAALTGDDECGASGATRTAGEGAGAACAAPGAVGLGGAQLLPSEAALRVPRLVATGPGIAVARGDAAAIRETDARA